MRASNEVFKSLPRKIMSPMRKSILLVGALSAGALIAVLISILLPFNPISAAGSSGKSQATKKRSSAIGRARLASASLQTARNLGKAFYEQGKYPESAEQFRKVIASGHALPTDHLDLALALMQANKLDAALGELTTAKQMDPKRLAIEYNLGILYKRELRYPDAETALKRVAEADPSEPSAWFNLGTVYFAERKFPEALDAYEHLNKMGMGRGQNFYVASLFRTFTVLLRLGRQQEAQKILKIHTQVHDKVPSISLQNQALEGGKYGAIIVPTAPPTMARRPEQKVAFADITAKLGFSLAGNSSPAGNGAGKISADQYSLDFARKNLVPMLGASVAVGDYDGDGHPDLYVVNPAGSNHLFHNNGDGTFSDVTEKVGVAGPAASVSATFADYDNSGHLSLLVAGVGGVTLYKNKGDGTFEDVTEKAGLRGKPGELDTRAVLFDADSDGFLDLVVTAYTDLNAPPQKDSFAFPSDFSGTQSHFYRNNGNGTFTDITESTGLNAARGRMRGVVFGPFTDSGYDDLVFFRDDAPPLLFVNQGEDRFVNRTHEAGLAFGRSIATQAQVADFNHDGNFDLVLWNASGPEVLFGRGNARFSPAHLPGIPPPTQPFAFRGTVADPDGDGFADLLAQDASGKWHFLSNHTGHFREGTLTLPAMTSEEPGLWTQVLPAWLSDPGKLDLIASARNGNLAAFEKEGPPAHWVQVKLKGYKSNMEGIGTIVEMKAGNFYSKLQITGTMDGGYTGDLTKLDVVRVTWPNQVVQNSVDVRTDTSVLVQESERLASSCPLLYVWNGRRFVFVTDVLGVGPLGELAPDGTYIKPNSREFIRLPGILRPRDGVYALQLTDELREVDFVDRLRLMAVDHPAVESILANEIYSSSPTTPELFAVRDERSPVSAVDDQGHDVLNLIGNVDDRYPNDFMRNRILGMADKHSLTLDLGGFPASDHVALWLTGWVFWTDSNGSRAMMTNPQLPMISPYLQVKDSAGKWVTVIPDVGLPSGTNRTMRVDLSGKFLSSDHHVRIVTNLCVYWDRIFFTTDDRQVQPSQVVAPLTADLHYRGFSVPVSDPNHLRPDYFEYTSLLKQAPWNPMTGNYTRYGDVRELLSSADDRLVVMAAGDEMTVGFSARDLAPLKPGWQRDFFLDAAGYAKDGEPNTAYSKTVSPLPFRAMGNYPPSSQDLPPAGAKYREYLKNYQTRPGHKLIPPLAPAVH
jgi:tetratricopeptide (TPR) repeat protein